MTTKAHATQRQKRLGRRQLDPMASMQHFLGCRRRTMMRLCRRPYGRYILRVSDINLTRFRSRGGAGEPNNHLRRAVPTTFVGYLDYTRIKGLLDRTSAQPGRHVTARNMRHWLLQRIAKPTQPLASFTAFSEGPQYAFKMRYGLMSVV
jgi:hypothetical protein